MKILKYLPIVILSLLLYSCEETSMPLFEAEHSTIYFETTTASFGEESEAAFEVPVVVAGVKGSDVNITVEVAPIGDNPAIEGTDYNIVNKTITVAGGTGIGYIQIQAINDNEFKNKRTFEIKLVSNSADFYMPDTLTNSVVVTIIDDDLVHPLSSVFGTYVQNDYLLADGTLDSYSPYDITISPVDGSETQVQIENFWGSATIKATVDIEAKTMEILTGQVIMVHDTYGECFAVSINLEAGEYENDANIACTIDEDGNIRVGAWAALVEAGSFGTYEYTDFIKN